MGERDAPGESDGPAVGELAGGSELGHYRIEQRIGRGGMGVVYRAHDLTLGRKLALKLLAPELAEDESFRERFLRESRIAASLDHRAIVPVYDAGELGGQLYIAMRLVDGTDLKRCLAGEGALEAGRALRLVEQVADALDAAHERGLVHRDVKPSNVLIDGRGHVYLADFGLSRRLAEPALVGGGGRSLGTVDYVAPEQIRGDELDGRADLYSLGCLLYECLAGRPPFAGRSETAVVFAHLQEDPPPLPGLERVIAKALAKQPEDRYASGRELVAAARAALGIEQPRRSRWPLAAAVVGVALVSAALLGFLVVTRDGSGDQAEPGANSLVRIDAGANEVVSTTPVGREASGVSAAGRYVWVTSFVDGTVWRIDPESRAKLRIPVRGSPTGVAAGSGSVLVANGPEHSLASVDPATGTVTFVKPLAGDAIGNVAVAAGAAGVWFADATEGAAAQLAGALRGGGAPAAQIRIPVDETSFLTAYESFDGLAVGHGAIWAVGDTFDRTLWRLDPATRRVVASVKLPFVPGSVAAGAGAVWVSSLLDDSVIRIDSVTNRVVATIDVPRGVVGLATGMGAVWVASSVDRTLSRIDPRTNRIRARVKLAGTPTHVAVGAGGVWVTTRPLAPRVPSGAIGIGLLADCVGPYGQWRDVSAAGAELALLRHGGERGPTIADGVEGARIAGKPVKLVFGCMNRTATSALTEARRLVEEIGVRIVIGPSYASEELALQEFARRHPEVTFVNGVASAQLLRPPPNMFAFDADGAEFMAGLGNYAYRKLGWRRAVVVGDLADRIFNWTQTAGFIAEFCSLGGTIADRIWVPVGTEDYSPIVARMPHGRVDGVFAASAPRTVVALANGDPRLRGNLSSKLVAGTLVDGPELGALGSRFSGVLTAGTWQTAEGMQAYLADMKRHFARFRNPANCCIGNEFDIANYDAMTAIASALAAVHGDLSGGGRRFMTALAGVRLASPAGPIRLDSGRAAVGSVYQVRSSDGFPEGQADGVEHTFGGYFGPGDPPPSRSTPACVRRTPPPWAR